MKISNKDLKIFSRQLILSEFKNNKFNDLQKKHIVIIGMGGIGCPLAQYLVGSGIKKLTIVDADVIKLENLNRQILYNINSVGKKKVDIAKKKLIQINPKATICTVDKKVEKKNIKKIIDKPSIIIDATDCWETMNIINRFCLKNYIPLLSASVIGFDGQVILFKNIMNHHLCLNCIFPNKKEPKLPRCDTVGVMGIAAGLTGLVAAQLTLNFFLKFKKIQNNLITISSKTLNIDQIKVKKNNKCSNIN